MIDVAVEDEAKVGLPYDVALPPLSDERLGLVADAAPPVLLTSAYWDAPDRRLLTHGITVRRRTKGRAVTWDVKVPVRGSATARHEATIADRSAEPPAAVTGLLLAWTGGDPLVAVATLRTRRLTWTVRDASGNDVAEVVDDEVEHVAGRRVLDRFREVEVERRGVDEAYVSRLVRRLVKAGGTPSTSTKVGRVVPVPAPAHPPKPRPSGPVSALVASGLAAAGIDLLVADVGARLGTEDAVHQMRVACRRMRSLLRGFGGVLDAGWRDALDDELKWVGHALGAARDAEVIEARLAKAAADLDAAAVLSDVAARRTAAEDEVRVLQSSERYVALARRVRTELAAPPVARDRTPGKDYAHEVVDKAERDMRRAVRRARRKGATDADWHAVRIAAKRLRYAAEASAPVTGAGFRKTAREAARAQDVLGAFHDTASSVAMLASIAETHPEHAFVAGRLAERETAAGRAALAAFGKAWR